MLIVCYVFDLKGYESTGTDAYGHTTLSAPVLV